MFYNSLAQSREQVVKIYVNCADIVMKDTEGKIVMTQVEPYWDEANVISQTKFKVIYKTKLAVILSLVFLFIHGGDGKRGPQCEV